MSNPCLHGGICINELLNYDCYCSDTGYTGAHCEIDINECASNPCVYGNCIDDVNSYGCICESGFAGARCDMISVCTADPCQNNGTCLLYVADNSYQCDCTDEFTGLNCELNVTESSDKTHQTGAVWIYVTIGLVVGGLVLVVIIVGVILLVRRYLCPTPSTPVPEPLMPTSKDDVNTEEGCVRYTGTNGNIEKS